MIENNIPEVKKKAPRCRKVHGELSPELYLRLESQAFQRGTTPYQLVGKIVHAFLIGGLVPAPAPLSDSAAPSPSPSVTGA